MGSFDDFIEKEKPEETKDIGSQIDKAIEENGKEKKTYAEKVKNKVKQQKQEFKKEPELSEKEKKQIKTNFFKNHKIKIGRREKKRIDKQENNFILDTQKTITSLAFIGVIFLFLLFQYNPGNEGITAIVFIMGGFLFLPIGAIVGWMFLDPFMRCKIMRKMTKGRKNYGIINFVGKGKKIVTRIKNFDEDLIWIKNKCWALTRSGIYELDKNGEQATKKKALDPDSFVTVTESVPTMFIDINSMQPLTFEDTGREGISPEELGSTLKGWVDNQMAKVMFLKKSLDAYFLIVIICALISAYFGYKNNQDMEELKTAVEELSREIESMQMIKLF